MNRRIRRFVAFSAIFFCFLSCKQTNTELKQSNQIIKKESETNKLLELPNDNNKIIGNWKIDSMHLGNNVRIPELEAYIFKKNDQAIYLETGKDMRKEITLGTFRFWNDTLTIFPHKLRKKDHDEIWLVSLTGDKLYMKSITEFGNGIKPEMFTSRKAKL